MNGTSRFSGIGFSRAVRVAAWLLIGSLFSVCSVLAEELPLSVSPSTVAPGQTVTASGAGFQPGARWLVWGGGPYVIGSADTPGFARSVALSGMHAYVAGEDVSSGLQVQVIDISDPHSPAIVGSLTTPYAWGVTVAGGVAYVAEGASGLQILAAAIPSTTTFVDSTTLQIETPTHLPPGTDDVTVLNPDGRL